MIEAREQRTYADILDRQLNELVVVESELRARGLDDLADRINEVVYQSFGIWWSMDGWEEQERREAEAYAKRRALFSVVPNHLPPEVRP